jgi:hypothetical protein
MTATDAPITNEPRHAEGLCCCGRRCVTSLAARLDSVVAEGFREAILIGDDAKSWDGHRRPEVGISVAVEFGGAEARR